MNAVGGINILDIMRLKTACAQLNRIFSQNQQKWRMLYGKTIKTNQRSPA